MKTIFTLLGCLLACSLTIKADYVPKKITQFTSVLETKKISEKIFIYDDGSKVLAGEFNKDLTVNGHSLAYIGGGSTYIINYNVDGAENWGAYLKGAATPFAVKGDANGNVYVSAQYTGELTIGDGVKNETSIAAGAGSAKDNVIIVAFDKKGNLLWHKEFSTQKYIGDDSPYLELTDFKIVGSKILFSAEFNGSLTLGSKEYKSTYVDYLNLGFLFLMHSSGAAAVLDTQNGTVLKSFAHIAKGDQASAIINSIAMDESDNVYLVTKVSRGVTVSEKVSHDLLFDDYFQKGMLLAKYNASSELVWNKMSAMNFIPKSFKQNSCLPKEVSVLKNGNLLVTGSFNDTLFFENNKLGVAPKDTVDVFAVSLDKEGNYVSGIAFGGAGVQKPTAVTSFDNKVVISSTFDKTIVISEDDEFDANNDTTDVYFAVYDFETKVMEAKQIGGDSLEYVNDIHANSNGEFALTGIFKATEDDKANFLGQKIVSSKDKDSKYIYDTYILQVVSNVAPKAAGTIANQKATVAAKFSLTFEKTLFTDDGDFTLKVVQLDDSELPKWLTFNAGTGVLAGTPEAAHVGTLNLKLVATDAYGSSAEISFELKIENTTTGIEDFNYSTVKVYPSVTDAEVKLENVVSAEVYNIAGVFQKKVQNATLINISELASGVYLVKATDKEGRISIHRILKK